MNYDELKDKWEPVEKVDQSRRKPKEWANIYHIELLGNIPNSLWSEYEWAYHLFTDLQYYPLPDRNKKGVQLDSYEKSAQKELRAMELKRDIFMGADMGEKKVLKEKYIETQWVRNRLNFM
ncbi:MAG: hypothetical protein ACOCP8_01325 [archaeon]